MNQPESVRITVAVLTYRRPADLAAALPLILAQALSIDCAAEVLVVDNDPQGSAQGLVGSFGAQGPVRYVHESRPGIAAARNRALREADESDVIVFIDDDERPVEGWLSALVDAYLRTRPAGVVGPVVSEFARPLEPWIASGRFFERRQHRSGTEVQVAATNNLLLDLEQVRQARLQFDDRFGLVGGSDTLFTRQLTGAGGRLVWCAEAVVIDVVPADRVTRRWVLRRAYRIGNSTSLIELELDQGSSMWLRRGQLVLRGGARVAVGLAKLLVGTGSRSAGMQARGARMFARGAGLLAGALGHRFAEYERASTPVASPHVEAA